MNSKKRKTAVVRKKASKARTPRKSSASAKKRARSTSGSKSTGSKIIERIQMGSHSLGNSVETVGKKLQRNGYNKLGTRIEQVGDLIENMGAQNNRKSAKASSI